MNPIAIIALAASLVAGIGLAFTAEPEFDTAGLVSESTAYSPSARGLGTPPRRVRKRLQRRNHHAPIHRPRMLRMG
jgi:hypothetical protein